MPSDEVTAAADRNTALAPPLFTVKRANRALALVRKVVTDVVAHYQDLTQLRAERDRLMTVKGAQQRVEEVQDELAACAEDLNLLARELSAIGCEPKDLRTGLVDFPAEHEGRRVWLCWRLGESSVAYWHEVDSGFTGRRPITDDFE